MKNVIRIAQVTGWAGLLWGAALMPAAAAGTSGAQFLKMGAGARASGMGEAFVAAADDATAAYYNPAGLTQLKNAEVSVMQNDYLVNSQYQSAIGAMPMGENGEKAVALSVYRMDFGTMDRYNETGAKNGSFSAGSIAAAASYAARASDNVRWGVTAKYVSESIESQNGSAMAADAGVMYVADGWTLGAELQHLGSSIKLVSESAPLPMTIRAGGALSILDRKARVTLDLSKPNDNDASVHVGGEYHVNSIVTVRGGYEATLGNQPDLGGLSGVTGGLGVNVGRFSLDYAIAPFGDLGLSHRLSVRVGFGTNDNQ